MRAIRPRATIIVVVLGLHAGRAEAEPPPQVEEAGTARSATLLVGGYELLKIEDFACFAGSSRAPARESGGGPTAGSFAAAAAVEDGRRTFPLVLRYDIAGRGLANGVFEPLLGSRTLLRDPSALASWVFANCPPSLVDEASWVSMIAEGGPEARAGLALLVPEWVAWASGGRVACNQDEQPLVGGGYQCWPDLERAAKQCATKPRGCGALYAWWRWLGAVDWR